MLIEKQKSEQKEYYSRMLETIGSLSRLYSESNEPYIAYRIAENLFCKAFEAENLSRTDCSADASKAKIGVGIKTFLEKGGATKQKIAEFNKALDLFKNLAPEKKIIKVSELRNERVNFAKRTFGLENMIYHCVTRLSGKILVYETPMDLVQVEKIKKINVKKNIIHFSDDLNDYSFNTSKSTLYKRFITEKILLQVPVKIIENPFDELEKLFKQTASLVFAPIRKQEHIFLPLYSVSGGEKYVPEKSGLNQWNAGGRARNCNEVYIKIPLWIHRVFPGFFPPRDTHFTLVLPNGEEMEAKVCQEGSKALMSKSNKQLGQWILRDVLDLKEGKLLTYDKLKEIGLDSVVIYKTRDGKFDIDFTKIGSFEIFENQNKE